MDYFTAKFSNLSNFQAITGKGDIGYYLAKVMSQNGFRRFKVSELMLLVELVMYSVLVKWSKFIGNIKLAVISCAAFKFNAK